MNGMTKEINYIGISNRKSIKFDKNSYLLEFEKKDLLIVGKTLTYGYLENNFSIGNKRGWFISEISMFEEDFNKCYKVENGIIKLNIK